MLNKLDTELVNELFSQALNFELVKYQHITFSYVEDGVPETGRSIHDMFVNAKRYGGIFKVFNGANEEENLYFKPNVNLKYRKLHDIHHAEAYSVGMGGTTKLQDELRLNCKMAWLAFSYTNARYDLCSALSVFFAVYHDTVGQVHYYREHGDFVKNQKALTIEKINECVGVEMLNLGRINQAIQVMQAYCKECNFTG